MTLAKLYKLFMIKSVQNVFNTCSIKDNLTNDTLIIIHDYENCSVWIYLFLKFHFTVGGRWRVSWFCVGFWELGWGNNFAVSWQPVVVRFETLIQKRRSKTPLIQAIVRAQVNRKGVYMTSLNFKRGYNMILRSCFHQNQRFALTTIVNAHFWPAFMLILRKLKRFLFRLCFPRVFNHFRRWLGWGNNFVDGFVFVWWMPAVLLINKRPN